MSYELLPKDGEWFVMHNGESVAGPCETRGDAFKAACEARGDTFQDLYDEDGNFAKTDQVRGGDEAIVLLREDGSVYGELDHERVAGGPPQHVSIEPATESSEAAS